MNVYDFDKTIYPGDSETHFWWFMIQRHPAALPMAAGVIPAAARFLAGRADRGELKARLYAVLRRVPDPAAEIMAFWDSHIDRIYPWYLQRRREDDVVISASSDFLIAEACRRLGIRCIATQMDPATGELQSPNCWGAEKPRRFRAVFGDAVVDEFYSDSWSDRPMMELAGKAFLMKKGRIAERVPHGAPAGKGEL